MCARSCQLLLQHVCDYNVELSGWVTEWLIVHAWKACVPKGTGGSNPPPSALTSHSCSCSYSCSSFNVSVPALAAPVAVLPCCRPAELHESSPSDKSCSCVQSPNLD